jgi:hypothetical protein
VTERLHTLVGLPRSGKTTFLAALWHLVNSGEVVAKWTLDKLDGDNQYLELIVSAWRRGEEVPRTGMRAECTVTIHLADKATQQRFGLVFPDLSGETFDVQCELRQCRPSYVEQLETGGGVLLFVNADRQTEGVTLLDLGELAKGEAGERKPWSPAMVPEQVRLVELLQFVGRSPFRRRRRRIGVVISGWDVLLEPVPTPEQWLARERPLLAQYLSSNSDVWLSRVFGVSAQGGNLKDSKERETLIDMTPSRRIRCVGPDTDGPHDLTCPLRWIVSERADD